MPCLSPGSDLGEPALWVRMMTLQCLVGVSGKEGGREGTGAVCPQRWILG